MTPFLKSIARAYASRYGDLSEFCFIFPNKRSGTFFLKHLKETLNSVSIAPETTTISSFIEDISGRLTDNRIDLLFLLYKAYRELKPDPESTGQDHLDFDSFRSWGDIILSDFNDLDMYDVDAAAMFKNLTDFKNIQTDFLTDEQRKVMEEYFGFSDQSSDRERFWKSLRHDYGKGLSGTKKKFLRLWEMLFPLYESLNRKLDEEGLAYSGKAYKEAYLRIIREGRDIFRCKKLVLVGFNALTKIEWLIFTALKKFTTAVDGREENFCDFIWDCSGPFLQAGGNSAGKFLLKDMVQFPSPSWLDLSSSDAAGHTPDIEIIAAPSNSIQAKIAGEIISRIDSSGKSDNLSNARVALVLPDEGLLMPVLNSIPENVSSVNLTMGYPLRLTSAYTFVGLLKRIQLKKQPADDGGWQYMAEDVKLLFSHPYMHMIAGAEAVAALKSHIVNLRKFWITQADIQIISPSAAPVFRPVSSGSSVDDTISYIDDALLLARDHIISAADGTVVKKKIDSDNIDAYRTALQRLRSAADSRHISFSYKSVFSLAERLLAAEKVNFIGEPLQGLQIMGLLETRCLDFDYIVIPSMNERIFPQRMRAKTFIPNALRSAYGMASSSYQESIFSYYFYRLITRARKVWLTFDSRSGDRQSGEPSRYLLQLQYIHRPGNISFKESRFSVAETGSDAADIVKDKAVMEILEKYREDGSGYNFSASSLLSYMQCNVRFFLEQIVGINPDPEPSEDLDAIALGNILHNTMMQIYLKPDQYNRYIPEGILIDRPRIEAILADRVLLEKLIRRNVNIEYYRNDKSRIDSPLKGSLDVSAKMMLRQVTNVLRHDLTLTPFRIYGCEIKDTVRLPLSDGSCVNLTYAIDRMDSASSDPEAARIRIIDYKTGKVYNEAESFNDMFGGDPASKHFFQLQLYANLHNLSVNGHTAGGDEIPVQTHIYDIGKMHIPARKQNSLPKLEGETICFHNQNQINSLFLSHLDALLREIMNPDIPFRTAADKSHCQFCNLKNICGV